MRGGFMSTTVSRVRGIARHLAKLSDEDIQMYINDASLEVPPSIGNTYKERMVRYLAAHLATLNVRRATSQSVSDISHSFNAATGHGLLSTEYGQEYLRLQRKATGAGLRVM